MFPSHDPGGADGNADFLAANFLEIAYTRDQISIAHTQSRNVQFVNCGFSYGHTLLTTVTHGDQNGRIDGRFDSCTGAHFERLFNVNLGSVVGTTSFNNIYFENILRLGDFGTSGSAPGMFRFLTFHFGFNHQNSSTSDYVPQWVMSGEPNGKLLFRS